MLSAPSDTVYRINRYLRIPHTYYFSAAGDDNANGSYLNPKRTFAAAMALSLMDGDNVLLNSGDVWKTQQLVVPASGAPGGRGIKFSRYGDLANPLLDPTARYTDFTLDSAAVWKRTDAGHNIKQVFQDGARMIYKVDKASMVAGSFTYVSGVVYVWCTDGGNPNSGHVIEYCTSDIDVVIKFNGKSYLVFDGIDVTKGNTTAHNTDLAGSNVIIVRNSTVSWMGGRAILIGTDITNTIAGCSDIIVDNCIAHDDLDVGIWLGRGNRFNAQNCTVYNEGADVAPKTKNYPTSGGQAHYPDGILVSGASVDCGIRENYVHDIFGGPAISDETSPTPSDHGTNSLIEKNKVDQSNTTDVAIRVDGINTIVRNNLIYQAPTVGYAIDLENTPTTPKIYYNTIISVSGAAHSVLFVTGSNISFKNNIIVRDGTTNRFISMFAAAGAGAVLDYNEYRQISGILRFLWGPASEYTSFAAWKGDTHAPDAHSLTSDPVFVTNYTDLHLQTTSPCKNAGATGLGVLDDYDSKVRDASPDIGAYEYS